GTASGGAAISGVSSSRGVGAVSDAITAARAAAPGGNGGGWLLGWARRFDDAVCAPVPCAGTVGSRDPARSSAGRAPSLRGTVGSSAPSLLRATALDVGATGRCHPPARASLR